MGYWSPQRIEFNVITTDKIRLHAMWQSGIFQKRPISAVFVLLGILLDSVPNQIRFPIYNLATTTYPPSKVASTTRVETARPLIWVSG